MRKNNIGVLIAIIILLIIFLPGAIYGTYTNYKNNALGGNPNKEFYYEGKLYFYEGDTLLGTYTCNTNTCGYATNYIDNTYTFESYNTNNSEIKVINNQYAFIKDGEKVILYDVAKEMKIIDYKAIKNYSVGITDNHYLVKNSNDLWGMIKIEKNISVTIPFKYEYLGLAKNVSENNLIDYKKIIAKDSDGWKLIDTNNNILATVSNEIVKYSDSYIVTGKTGDYQIFDYSGNEILNAYILSNVDLLENLAITTTNNGYYVIYNATTNSILKVLQITNAGEYFFKIENNSLIISQANNVIETIALS